MSIEIPDDLKNALERSGATALFNAYDPVEQQKFIDKIEEQKRPETREHHVNKCVHLVRSGLLLLPDPPPGKPKKKKKR